MTNNSDRQREIEELIERLMAEKHNHQRRGNYEQF